MEDGGGGRSKNAQRKTVLLGLSLKWFSGNWSLAQVRRERVYLVNLTDRFVSTSWEGKRRGRGGGGRGGGKRRGEEEGEGRGKRRRKGGGEGEGRGERGEEEGEGGRGGGGGGEGRGRGERGKGRGEEEGEVVGREGEGRHILPGEGTTLLFGLCARK